MVQPRAGKERRRARGKKREGATQGRETGERTGLPRRKNQARKKKN